MKKHKILCILAVLLIFLGSLVALKWNAIFQRGNPIPYLIAAAKLSDENPYAAVGNMEDIYITRRGNKQALFQMVENTYHVKFKDQIGSSYLFSNGEKNYTVGSEIYWGRLTVWTLFFDCGYPVS